MLKVIKRYLRKVKFLYYLISRYRTYLFDHNLYKEEKYYSKLNRDSPGAKSVSEIQKLYQVYIDNKKKNQSNDKIKIFAAISDEHSIWMQDAYLPPLKKFGETYYFDCSVKYNKKTQVWFPNLRDKMNETMVSEIDKFFNNWKGTKLFFGHLTNNEISGKTIEQINKRGIITINVSMNENGFFGTKKSGVNLGMKEIAKYFDLNWVTCSRMHSYKYTAEGANMIYLATGAPLETYYDLKQNNKSIDVLFVGHKWNKREWTCNYLKNHGIKITTFGRDWDNGFVTLEELNRLYNSSRIVLGIGHYPYSDILTDLKPRDFEIPMSGAFYLTIYNSELEEHYKIGSEIECYSSDAELLQKIIYYLDNPEQTERIAAAGALRARNNHTWDHRFKVLFEKIKVI